MSSRRSDAAMGPTTARAKRRLGPGPLLGLIVLAGCSSTDGTGRVEGPAPSWTTPSAGLRFLAPVCTPGEDTCGGFDDDCDGVIDEGCGFIGGDVQVVLTTLDDLEARLVVHSPVGGHRLSSTSDDVEYGGRFQSNRTTTEDQCRFDRDDDGVQSARWEGREPDFLAPRGTYRVEVAVTSDCERDGVTRAPFRLDLSVGGASAGTFEWEQDFDPFTSTEYVEVLTFTVE